MVTITRNTFKRAGLNIFWACTVFMLLLIYLNVNVYYSVIGHNEINMAINFSILLLGVATLLIFGMKRLPINEILSYFGILGLSVISYAIFQDQFALALLNSLSLGAVILITFIFIFSAANGVGVDMQVLFLLGSIFATLFNIIDFFFQGEYFKLIEGFGQRAAGFYINSNNSAEGILLGMILGISMLSTRYREAYVYFCALGILLTASRGAFLVFFLIVATMIFYKTISLKKILIFAIGLALSIGWLASIFAEDIDFLYYEKVFGRVFGDNTFREALDDDRLKILDKAIDIFITSPIFGGGGYALLRDGNLILAHNQYAQIMSDFGIIGLFFYFALLLSAMDFKNAKSRSVFMFVFLLFFAFFTHSLLNSYAVLIAIGYLSTQKIFRNIRHINTK
jgi:O-antigen ligase